MGALSSSRTTREVVAAARTRVSEHRGERAEGVSKIEAGVSSENAGHRRRGSANGGGMTVIFPATDTSPFGSVRVKIRSSPCHMKDGTARFRRIRLVLR